VRRLVIAAIACAALSAAGLGAPASGLAALPPIHHVFMIVLENESASTTFGANSKAPYLAQTLRAEGAFLPQYHGTGHESNDNYIAMISGQAPNAENQADCMFFNDMTPGTIGAYGQAQGEGCVYPSSVQTIAGQLQATGHTWRDYDEDMGADPTRESGVCAHPGLNQPDGTQKATAKDQYATRHNPFVYFHSIIDDTTLCDTHVVNLSLLPQDLKSAASTPNYVFITPNLCDDGHDAPCANGQPGGLTQINTFLRSWVPRITHSPAYADNGLLIITFDEAATSDTSSCCGEIPGPGSPKPGISGPGGGDVGAVLLSPCIAPGTVSQQPYNHYTMLRSVEDMFGLPHLGYAGLPGEQSFGSDIFRSTCGGPSVRVIAPALASRASTRPRFKVRWRGAKGIARFKVQVRRAGTRRWRTLLARTKRHSLHFTGRLGQTYQFRVEGLTTSGAHGASASATTVVPSGVGVAGGRYHGPWRVASSSGAWEGQTTSCSTHRCSFHLGFRGTSLAIIGRLSPHGGRIRVTLDGHSRTVSLRSSRRRERHVLFQALTGRGHHVLRLQVLGGVVSLEGFAIGR
jgi:phosphatidylinositol-3-phosphatase